MRNVSDLEIIYPFVDKLLIIALFCSIGIINLVYSV
jgi:hypothetical protein